MGKKASARIKNKVKMLFARSISHLEKTVAKDRVPFNDSRAKKTK